MRRGRRLPRRRHPRRAPALAFERQGSALRLRSGLARSLGEQPRPEPDLDQAAGARCRRHAARLQAVCRHHRLRLPRDPRVGRRGSRPVTRARRKNKLVIVAWILAALSLAALLPALVRADDSAPRSQPTIASDSLVETVESPQLA